MGQKNKAGILGLFASSIAQALMVSLFALMPAAVAFAQTAPAANGTAATPAPTTTATPTVSAGPLTAEAMWDLARISSPTLSPDGRYTVVAVTRYDRNNDESRTGLYLVPTDPNGAARQLTAGTSSDSSPVFSPDGRTIAFTSRRTGDSVSQLYVIDIDGGEARRITQIPTGVNGPQWMPNGQEIAFISAIWADLPTWEAQGARLSERNASKMTAQVFDNEPISYWDHLLDDRENHIFAVNRTSLAIRSLTRDSSAAVEFRTPGASDYAIAPDGKELAFVAETDRSGTHPNSDIYVRDIPVSGDATGVAVNITTSNPAGDDSPAYSPDGRFLAYTANRVPTAPDRSQLHVRSRNGASSLGGEDRVLAADWDWSIGEFDWLPDSRGFYVGAEDRPTHRIFELSLTGNNTPRRITGAGDMTEFKVARLANGQHMLVSMNQSFSSPPNLVAIDPRNGQTRALTHFNDAALANLTMGRVESVTIAGSNGDPMQMWVVYPPNFDPSKRYPVNLLLHGGPHVGITDAWTWRWNAQVMAGWGYVVAWHNFHGSSGFGDVYTDSINPDRTTMPYQDTILAANWFAAQPWVDKDRMVAAGGSYGGYLASVLLGRPHPFRALVAHAAVFDNFTQLGADYGATEMRFPTFWEDLSGFLATSPNMQAASFNTPTLVIHGQLDRRVPISHSYELFSILQQRGVESRFIYYPNENHWILHRQNSIFWYNQVENWIGHYAPAGPNMPALPYPPAPPAPVRP